MIALLLLPALALAEDPWFYLDEGQERATIAADSTIAGLPVRRTGAVVVATTAPTTLGALPGVTAVEPLGHGDAVFRLRTAPGTDEIALARALHARADVAWANPDLAVRLLPMDLPDDPYVADQWHLQNTGQQGWTPGCDIDAPTAWALSTGTGMMVAVIDTGVDTDHPDLRVTPGWDYVDGDADPNPSQDYDGWPHGTCAAGLAAATGDNAIGVAGVAYDAEVYAIRLIGGDTSYGDIYDAFVEATDAGAAVISNSWGFTDCQSYMLPATIRSGLDYAEVEGRGGLGTAVVFSAGNGNCDASHDGMLGYDTVIGVAAVDGDDEREWYSSYGSIVDVAAPSGAVLTTDPAGSEGYGAWRDDPDYYGYFSGTSAAAPVVSGTLALMFAANPRLTAEDAREILWATADRIHPEAWDYDEEGWNTYMGFGRIDAGAAVLAVANAAPAAPVVLGPSPEAFEDRVALRWDPADDDDGDWLTYTVTWWTEGATTGTVEATTGTTLDITGLVQAGDTVSWQVQAADLWGPGGWPTVQQFGVLPIPQRPEPPATGCAARPGRATLACLVLAALVLPRRRPSSDRYLPSPRPGCLMRAVHLLALAAFGPLACSEYDLYRPDDGHGNNPDDTGVYDSGDPPDDTQVPGDCAQPSLPGAQVGVNDECGVVHEGTFTPVIEWNGGAGEGCLSQPLVADMNDDGLPEIIANFTTIGLGPGKLKVLYGDGSGIYWQDSGANLAYGSPPALGDIDGDGRPEIVVVREYASSLFADGDYAAALYDDNGTELWESEHFVGLDFDWATAPVISDMDHDGSFEIVVGRVILNGDDGSTRGVGEYGRGSYGIVNLGTFTVSESSVPAVSDLDLDGQEEVIVGNAAYDSYGNALRVDESQDDAMISIANLDSDPEGEIIGISYNTIRAMDTDGTVIWGPKTVQSANILAPAGIADVDLDGMPEIVTAGGNELVCYNHDGTVLWTSAVTDMSGATGASFFDFEGDGEPEVVYIDEVEMIAFEGATGRRKFYSTEHSSQTMFDYPTIADVDADDHAEIVVAHNGYGYAFSVYGDQDNSWVPARDVWNQHAYDIDNVNDDASIPSTRSYGFTTHNTWHSSIFTDGAALEDDLEAEITDVCLEDCDLGRVWVALRLRNVGLVDTDQDLSLALYASSSGSHTLLTTVVVPAGTASGWSADATWVQVDAADLAGADALWLAADDDGTGTGLIRECSEANGFQWNGPFCE